MTEERRRRAEARRKYAVVRKTTLRGTEHDFNPVYGEEALSLLAKLNRESFSLSGSDEPSYERSAIPCRFVPGQKP